MARRPPLVRFTVNLFSWALMLYYRFRNPAALFGQRIIMAGLPLLKFHKRSTVVLGNDLVFISLTRGNYAGLTKGCSIFVGEHAELRIGNDSWFSGVSIYCSTKIEIGSHVLCGANCSIWDTDFHPLEWQARRVNDRSQIASRPVRIGDDAFIGGNSTILKGVTIGARSIIGAGSVVVKSVPEDEIWAGNPATFIKRVPKKEYVYDAGQIDAKASS